MSIRTGDLPVALDGEPIDVVATQGEHTVRATLPPAARNPVATRRDMDAGISNTTQVTPAAIFPFIDGARAQQRTAWKFDPSLNVLVGKPASSRTAYGTLAKTTANVLTGSFTFDTLSPRTSAFTFYDDATGIPTVPGDTLRVGFLFGYTPRRSGDTRYSTSRLTLTYWTNFGPIFHQRLGAGTQSDPYRWSVVSDEDDMFQDYFFDAPLSRGWYPGTTRAVEVANAATASKLLVCRATNSLELVIVVETTPGNFSFQQRHYDWRAPAADITGAQVVTALSGLTGANRLDAQFIKNLAAGEEGNGVPNNNSVSTVKIQDMAVTDAKIADATITPAKFSTTGVVSGQVMRFVDGAWTASNETAVDSIGEGTINAASLATGAVTSRSINDDAVTSSKIADGAVTEDRLASNAVVQSKIANNSVGLAEVDPAGSVAGQLLGIDSGGDPAWLNPASVATVPDGAISTGKLVDDAVTQAKIADASVGTPQLIDGSVTTQQLGASAVSADKLASSAVGVSHISPAGTANQVLTMNATATGVEWRNAQAAIDTLADGSVTAIKIADNAISSAKLADGSVTTTKIGGNAITTAKIAGDAVDGTKIADNSIGTEHINVAGQTDGAVLKVSGSTATWQVSTLANNAVTSEIIRNGAVINTKIANDAITDNKIADGAVSVDKLSNDAVESAKIKDGNVTLAKISTAGATANQVIKMNSAGTAWETAAESAQATGVTLVDSLIDLNTAHTTLPAGGQIRIGTSFTDSANSLSYRRGETYRKTVSSWQNVSQVIDGSTLQDNSIVAAHLQSDSVTQAKIADNSVGTPQIADDAITLSKMANGSVSGDQITADAVPVSKMSAEGGTNDYFIARKNGEVVWQRRLVADNLAGSGVADTFLSLNANLVPTWSSPYPNGYANGLMLGYSGDRIQWLQRPIWYNLGGAVASAWSNTAPNRLINTTLVSGANFADYDEIEFVGKDRCYNVIVSKDTWSNSSSTQAIRLHADVVVYRDTDTSYVLSSTNSITSANGSNYGVVLVRGKRWPPGV